MAEPAKPRRKAKPTAQKKAASKWSRGATVVVQWVHDADGREFSREKEFETVSEAQAYVLGVQDVDEDVTLEHFVGRKLDPVPWTSADKRALSEGQKECKKRRNQDCMYRHHQIHERR